MPEPTLDIIYDLTLVAFHKCISKIETLPTNKEKQKAWDSRCSVLRYLLEPYIYNHMQEKYGLMLSENWKEYIPPKKSQWAYCLVERRPHPNFWFILRNMAWAAPQMSVYIFCSDENESFIRTLLGNKAEHFNIIQAFEGNPPKEQAIQEYNDFYTDYRNYEKIDAEYIMTMQMDVIIRRKLDMRMFQTDYYGNPWAWNSKAPGGGGASVRYIPKMIELCKRFRSDPDSEKCTIPEDGWMNKYILETESTFPHLEMRATVFMESFYIDNPYVVHQSWSFCDSLILDGKESFIEANKKIYSLEI
jgi:hypothetical protein